MKIQPVSDLHLEFVETPVIENAGADVLILGGDITTGRRLKSGEDISFFEDMASKFDHVIYYLGNHEFYHGDFVETPKIVKKALKHIPNLHLLNNYHVMIDGVMFWGGTLWTDCNRGNPETLTSIRFSVNDYRLIKHGHETLTPQDTFRAHKMALEELKVFLTSFYDMPMVIATHHSPSLQSVAPQYKNDFHMNGAFHSELSYLMVDVPNIRAWVHGHTHQSMMYYVGNSMVVANPAGYPMRNRLSVKRENPDFKPNLIIDIGK